MAPNGRIHYIDWLRVLAVLLLFPFHTSRVFNFGEPFYVKASQTSIALSYVLGFIDMWHMPLLFLLAGASTYLALGKRSTRQYVAERLRRLLVPLVFGTLVLIPPQTWYGARFNSGYTDSFWQYMVSGDFLVWNIQEGGDYYGGFGIGQLWFILYLLVISFVALPAVLWARGERGRATTERLAGFLAHPVAWLAPAIVLWIAEGLPDPIDKSFFMYLAYFLLGFVVISTDALPEAAERNRWWALAAGAVICAAWVGAWEWREALPDPSLSLSIANIGGMLGSWMVIVGLIGAGRRYLDRPSPTLSYLAESSYPVYMLHQTAIVVIAFYIVQAVLGGPLQWLAILVGAVAATFAVYEVVRRAPALRFLFGMRPAARGRGGTV